MTKTIEGVPTQITQTQLMDMIEDLGIDPKRVLSMALDPGQVTVVMLSAGPDGKPFGRKDGSGFALDTIRIKVVSDGD